MKRSKALQILEEVSNRYLFSNIGQRELAYAGDYYDDSPTKIEERIERCFQTVEAAGVSVGVKGEYALRLYYTEYIIFASSIAEHYNVPEQEITFQQISPFQLQSFRRRPLQIGTYIGHLMSDFEGTLGCFVTDREGQKFVLSNHHVLYNQTTSYEDDFIIQPGTTNGGTKKDAIGLFAKTLPFNTREVNRFDAAMAGPLRDEYDLEYLFSSKSQKIKGVGSPSQELKIYKCGAASGTTFGKIVTYPVNLKIKVDEINVGFKDQMIINGSDEEFSEGGVFSQGGDSGSIVIDYESHMALGLLVGGSDSGLGFATPLEPVLRELGVAILQ